MTFDNLFTLGSLIMLVVGPICIVQYFRSQRRFCKTCLLLIVFFKIRIKQGYSEEEILEKTQELYGDRIYNRALKLYNELYPEELPSYISEPERRKFEDVERILKSDHEN